MTEQRQKRDDGSVPAGKPVDELVRVAKLHELLILDTGKDERFDRITKLVSELLDVPIVLVSLLDESREWFKSTFGTEMIAIEREQGFCAHGILQPDDTTFTIVDALTDPRFATHPFVIGDPQLRFYCGAPLITKSGQKIGMLCVHDFKPRHDFDDRKKAILQQFAQITMDEINFHRSEFERNILIGELSHRVKNLYSTISSIARTSIKNGQTAVEYVATFTDRVSAMAAAHDKLLENSWEGADLLDIVLSVLDAHQNVDSNRFVFDFSEVPANPELTQSFALCIHELLINSIKYGALKHPAGQVYFSCRRKTQSGFYLDLFTWREIGGEPTTAPAHRGFGHRMLESTIKSTGGEIKFNWKPEGLVCKFEMVTKRGE